MAVAIVAVAGRTYRVGCEEGQEQRLEELARAIDAKVAAMRQNFGEIGDQRMVVMAALEIADESADSKARVAALETQIETLRQEAAAREARAAALEAALAARFDEATQRLTQIVKDLSSKSNDLDFP